MRTPNGKEIKLAPGELTITACNGINESTEELKQIYIQLNDQEGITIRSTEEIHINSDKDIHFSADKNLVVEALESIELRCGPSQIAVAQGAVSISSPQVKLQE